MTDSPLMTDAERIKKNAEEYGKNCDEYFDFWKQAEAAYIAGATAELSRRIADDLEKREWVPGDSPNRSGFFNVTVEHPTGDRNVYEGEYLDGKWDFEHKVIAWRSLPSPYQPPKEELK